MQKNSPWENKSESLRRLAEVIFMPTWVSFQRKEGLKHGV